MLRAACQRFPSRHRWCSQVLQIPKLRYGSLWFPDVPTVSERRFGVSKLEKKHTFVTGNIAFDCCCVHQHMLLDPDALETASLVPVHLSRLCPGNPFPLELLSPNSRPQMVVFLFFNVPVACVHYVAACLHVPPNPPWSPSPSRIPAGPEFPLPYVA